MIFAQFNTINRAVEKKTMETKKINEEKEDTEKKIKKLNPNSKAALRKELDSLKNSIIKNTFIITSIVCRLSIFRVYINNGGSQDFCYTWFTKTKNNERNPKCPHQFTNLSSVYLTLKSFPTEAVRRLKLKQNTSANDNVRIAVVPDFARKIAFYEHSNIMQLA